MKNTQGSGGAGTGPVGDSGTGPKKQRRPRIAVIHAEGRKP